MASNPYVKSLFWLLSTSGIGYALMIFTTPSEEKIRKIRATAAGVLSEDEKKKVLFLKKLKEAANLKESVDLKKGDI